MSIAARIVCLVLLASLALVAGCKATVHTRATELSANEVLSALLEAGIKADKLAVDERTFDIEVAQGDLGRALAVLRSAGLPRPPSENLGQLFRKEGLVSTPAEERVRFVFGLSQELEQTIARIDGVVQARVHVVIPANDPLSDTRKFSSTSVFIKYRPPVDPEVIGPLVRSLVMRAIEGLDNERVSVAFVAAQPVPAAASERLVSWMGASVAAGALLPLSLTVVLVSMASLGLCMLALRPERPRAVKG